MKQQEEDDKEQEREQEEEGEKEKKKKKFIMTNESNKTINDSNNELCVYGISKRGFC